MRPSLDLEDLLGGRVLAWLGGIAVLAGLAFLLTIAISRGWIGEGARTALAGLLSAGLFGAGVWLREQRGRTEAALAAAAVGIAGGFGTLIVAGAVYHLVPLALALIGAAGVGAAATTLAIRWRAEAMGWLGLLGALLAPATLGALGAGGLAFLAIAYAATIAVLLWRRWFALSLVAFTVTSLQLIAALASHEFAPLPWLIVFGVLSTTLTAGLEWRRQPVSAAVLISIDAVLLEAIGWWLLHDVAWLVALAAVHVGIGIAARKRTTGLITLALGVALADIAFAAAADGITLTLGWSALAAGLALVALRTTGLARNFALAGLGSQLALALAHLLAFDAPVTLAAGGTAPASALLATAAFGAAALVHPWTRPLALAALAYLTALAFDGVLLTCALALQAIALTIFARRAPYAGLAFAVLALTHALTTLAPPQALVHGLDDPLAAAGALLAAAAALAAGRTRAHYTAAALTLLYLASTELAAAGQLPISVLWALAGVGTLIAGLVRDDRALRQGALLGLALTIAKVFFYDLASLDSLSRVASFIALGLLLLAGAFAWQRARPLPS